MRAFPWTFACLALFSCQPPDRAAPDFRLRDVNPASATHDQAVSPRDALGRVSGWYFTHTT